MHTELARKLLQMQALHEWTQQRMADYAGVTQPSINALIQGSRASHRVLRGICQQTPRDVGAEIMLAHLADEIRGGGYLNSEIVAGVGRLEPTTADDMRARLDRIASVARRRKDIGAMIVWLADVAEALEAYQAPDLTTSAAQPAEAAEQPSEYRPADPKKPSAKTRMRTQKPQH